MVANSGLFDSKLPHNNPAVLLFIHGKCPSPQELFGVVVVHINKCSQKGSLVWLVDHLLYSKKKKKKKKEKKPPNKMDFSFFPKEEKNKKIKIKIKKLKKLKEKKPIIQRTWR